MSQQFQTISKTSVFSRLGSSIKGIFVGIIIFLIGFPVLWKNESNAIKNTKALNELQGNFVNVGAPKKDAANEGKPVFMSGMVETQDILADRVFGISESAICLERSAEIYQWVEDETSEEKKKLGGGTETVTTYTYKAKWVQAPVDSDNFTDSQARQNYRNTGTIKFADEKQIAQNVKFGDFKLTSNVISKIGGSESYKFAADFQLSESLKAMGARIDNAYIVIPAVPQPGVISQIANAVATPNAQATAQAADAVAQTVANAVSTTSDSTTRIGDVRYKFSIIRPHEISFIATQQGDTFVDYTAKNGKTQFLFKDGPHSADELIAAKASSNKFTRWCLRLLGFILMYIGISKVFGPLRVVSDIVPFIGKIVGMGLGLLSALIAGFFTLLTIAVAWIAVRPILGISLLVGAVVLFALFIKMRKQPVNA